LNGVALLNPSAGSGNPSGKAAPPTGYNYNAGSPDTLFGEDTAGGHPNQQGQYHYHAFSFGESWTDTAVGGTVVDATKIAYLGGSLTHADGHSKILGFAFDVSGGCGVDCYQSKLPPRSFAECVVYFQVVVAVQLLVMTCESVDDVALLAGLPGVRTFRLFDSIRRVVRCHTHDFRVQA
jgi:hypothetical protein